MYTHLTREERVCLEAFLREGYDLLEIADALGRSKATVSRELRRNLYKGGYHAGHARMLAKSRRKDSKWHCRKIENNKALLKTIVSRLNPLASPEVVAYELGLAH